MNSAHGVLTLTSVYHQHLGYPYAGAQNGNECWCDDSYGGQGQDSETGCAGTCRGDPSTICGDGWRNSVFSTGLWDSVENGFRASSTLVKQSNASYSI